MVTNVRLAIALASTTKTCLNCTKGYNFLEVFANIYEAQFARLACSIIQFTYDLKSLAHGLPVPT
jgi:hypothetical protein